MRALLLAILLASCGLEPVTIEQFCTDLCTHRVVCEGQAMEDCRSVCLERDWSGTSMERECHEARALWWDCMALEGCEGDVCWYEREWMGGAWGVVE